MSQLSKVTMRTRQWLVCRLLHLINQKQQIVLPIKSLVRLSLLIPLVIQSRMQSQFIMLMILKMLRKLLKHQHHKLLATKLKVNWYCQLTSAWTPPYEPDDNIIHVLTTPSYTPSIMGIVYEDCYHYLLKLSPLLMKNLKRSKKLHQLFRKLHQLFQKLHQLF